jgi:hypothetical protein
VIEEDSTDLDECVVLVMSRFGVASDVERACAGVGKLRRGGSLGPIASQEAAYALEQNLSKEFSMPTSRGSVCERLQFFPRLQELRQKYRMQKGFP